MIRRALVLGVLFLLLAGCSEKSVLEEGGPRVANDVGVATDVTFDRIQLDGERTYEIDESVESFATRSHHVTSLLSWEGKYVHVGLDDDDRAVWIAGIGILSGKPAKVRYSGVFESFDADRQRATFEDGTVLEFASSVKAPERGREVVVEIDAERDLVTKILD
jgi:hypothetical protein